jgi:hypothetical protein
MSVSMSFLGESQLPPVRMTPIADSEPLAIVSREPLLESGLGVFFKHALNKTVFLFVLFRRNALDYRYAFGWRFDRARGER